MITAMGPCLCHAGQMPLPALTSEEQAWLQANRDKITLSYSVDFPPIEYISEYGILTGLAGDIMAEVEARLSLRFHQQPSNQWSQVLAALQDGSGAVAPCIVRSTEREAYTYFTTPYITIPVVIITSQSVSGLWTLHDLAGKRVAVVADFVTESYLRDHSHGRYEIVPVLNVADGMRRAAFGQVDAFVENIAVAAYYSRIDSLPNLHVAGEVGLSYPLSIGVSRHYPLLFSAIEKALADIPPQQLLAIQNQWISLQGNALMSPAIFRLLLHTIIFSILLLLGLGGITLYLKKQLKEKMHRLQDAQNELSENEQKYRELVENAASIILRVDARMRLTFINEFGQRFFGFHSKEILGQPLIGTIVPATESSGRDLSALLEAIRSRPEKYVHNENENICKDGRRVWVAWDNKPLYDEEGGLGGMLCVGSDITERRRSYAEREKLQAQLHLAQKMESIGRMAGGVAHDFNNMLSAIVGYTELALKKITPENEAYSHLEQALNAADRSASLIRQLLTFSRQQRIAPQSLDLNQAITTMLKMLQRLIGEDIYLMWQPAPGLWPVMIDPTQIDQIVTNLCVNARDAIPGVGQVRIQTRNVSFDAAHCSTRSEYIPGDFVMLEVMDNGCGMEPETLANIFDPFFTTKTEEEGTGLGLATIYGIVQQNNGFIIVESKPGKGTVFKVYLPRSISGQSIQETASDNTETIPSGKGEWILLVEDEPAIMDVTRQMLKALGYEVLALQKAEDAVILARMRTGPIDLLITDVVMPRINGRQLADHLLALRPGLPCLFMSGHNADAIARYGVFETGVSFIHKPFSIQALAFKVHETLAGKSDSG